MFDLCCCFLANIGFKAILAGNNISPKNGTKPGKMFTYKARAAPNHGALEYDLVKLARKTTDFQDRNFPQKVAFRKGNPLISEKSRLVKYYKLARYDDFFLFNFR